MNKHIKNFQKDNQKYNYRNQTNIYNPSFQSNVVMKGKRQSSKFERNLDKWIKFVSWARWNYDLFLDLITPPVGGIKLDLDQRIFLRCLCRFISTYGVFPRGWAKTYLGILALYLTAIFYPDIELSLTAQTKENASQLLEEKHREILKHFPLIANEVLNSSFTKNDARIDFTSGSIIDTLANQQSSKGRRRNRINIEESNLLNNELYEDVIEPIPNIPRRTIGEKALVNPEELNWQINFFTTSGFRGTSEYERNIKMVDDMAELKGKIVIGSDWRLACHFGRGETKSQILNKKEKLSPTFFKQNYMSQWVGTTSGALVDISKVMALRNLKTPELKMSSKDAEYVIAVDVARSSKTSSNQSSVAVLKITRSKNGRIKKVFLVNLINLQQGLTFFAQSVEVKRIKNLYNAKVVVVDGNAIGAGLVDELMRETIDPVTNEDLGCWDTINTDDEPELEDSEQIIYNLKAQGINHDIIVNFIDFIESKKLALLIKRINNDYDMDDIDYFKSKVLPYVQTDLLIEEVANLKLKQLSNGKYKVERQTKTVDKDRYSALAYGLWYIKTFEEVIKEESKMSANDYLLFN